MASPKQKAKPEAIDEKVVEGRIRLLQVIAAELSSIKPGRVRCLRLLVCQQSERLLSLLCPAVGYLSQEGKAFRDFQQGQKLKFYTR